MRVRRPGRSSVYNFENGESIYNDAGDLVGTFTRACRGINTDFMSLSVGLTVNGDFSIISDTNGNVVYNRNAGRFYGQTKPRRITDGTEERR